VVAVADGVALGGASAADGVVAAAGVGDDREERRAVGRQESRPRREIQAPLRADGVRRAVALAEIVGVEEQRVDRLIALEVDDPQHLPAVDAPDPGLAREDHLAAGRTRRIESAFDQP
jgi:hypothetical protein